MVNNIRYFFVKKDNFCDYIPVISTASNLFDIFQKTLYVDNLDKKTINNDHYYKHLKQKSNLRCIILLIPIFGNIAIGIYDFVTWKYHDKEMMLAEVQKDGLMLQHASEKLKNDPNVVSAAIKNKPWATAYIGEELKNDPDFVLSIAEGNPEILKFVGEDLNNNRNFVLAIVQKNGHAIQNAQDRFKNDEEIANAALEQNIYSISYISKRLQDDRIFILSLVKKNCSVFEVIDKKWRGDEEIAFVAVSQNGVLLRCASEDLQNNPKIAHAAMHNSSLAIEHVGKKLQKNIAAMIDIAKDAKSMEYSMRYASQGLRDNEDFIDAMVMYHGLKLLEFASARLRSDQSFMNTMLKYYRPK